MSRDRVYFRRRLYLDKDFGWRILGFYSTQTAARTATAITDAVRFGPSMYGEFEFADGWIRHRLLTGAERVKMAGELSGTTLLHADGANWTASGAHLTYEWNPPFVHPDELDQCIVDACLEVYTPSYEAVSAWEDGNFSEEEPDDWIAGASAPSQIEKTLSSEYNLTGPRSLLVTNSGANQYAVNANDLHVMPGQTWRLPAYCKVVRGSSGARWSVWNVTNPSSPVQIGDYVDAVGYAHVRLPLDVTIPANCYLINCRLQGVDSNAIVAWDTLPAFKLSDRRFVTPSWMDAGFKLIDFVEVHCDASFGVNLQDAASKRFERWIRGRDYHTDNLTAESSPNAVQVDKPEGYNYPANVDLWYHGRRPSSDFWPLSDEYMTSDMDEQLMYAAIKAKVCDLLYRGDHDANWLNVASVERAKLAAQFAARQEPRPPTKPQHFGGRLGPRGGNSWGRF